MKVGVGVKVQVGCGRCEGKGWNRAGVKVRVGGVNKLWRNRTTGY